MKERRIALGATGQNPLWTLDGALDSAPQWGQGPVGSVPCLGIYPECTVKQVSQGTCYSAG